MKKFLALCAVLCLSFTLASCGGTPETPPEADVGYVTITSATANGTSNMATSSVVTLTFDRDPTTLDDTNITVTGATKGALAGEGNTRTLGISNISVANRHAITISISNPTGFIMCGSPKYVNVFVEMVPSISQQRLNIAYDNYNNNWVASAQYSAIGTNAEFQGSPYTYEVNGLYSRAIDIQGNITIFETVINDPIKGIYTNSYYKPAGNNTQWVIELEKYNGAVTVFDILSIGRLLSTASVVNAYTDWTPVSYESNLKKYKLDENKFKTCLTCPSIVGIELGAIAGGYWVTDCTLQFTVAPIIVDGTANRAPKGTEDISANFEFNFHIEINADRATVSVADVPVH